MPFTPGARSQAREMEPMYYDVPAHLAHQLITWMRSFVNDNNAVSISRVRDVANHMRFDYAQIPRYSHKSSDYSMAEYIEEQCENNAETLLQVIEFVLPRVDHAFAARLEMDLRLGNSAYAVSSNGKQLEMRVTPAVKAQIEDVISAAGGSAGDHLTNAWNGAYGRQPDPVKSYSEIIKAVEAALAARVTPAELKADPRHDDRRHPESPAELPVRHARRAELGWRRDRASDDASTVGGANFSARWCHADKTRNRG